MAVPIVDFSPLSLEADDEDLILADVGTTAGELVEAFTTFGFVYLKNVGVAHRTIDDVNSIMRKFVSLPDNVKRKYIRTPDSGNNGWIEMGQESLNPSRPGDLKEAFNTTADGVNSAKWSVEEVPTFAQIRNDFFLTCTRLSHRVLRAIAIGLNLPDPCQLVRFHNTLSRPGSTTLRFLLYPPIGGDIQPNQIRLGEHTDYGSITLLFQDSIGGLQIRSLENDWVDATPIDDTVLVNIGDLLQRWTEDRLRSTQHRVLNPVDPDAPGWNQVRQSIAFFFHPDSDTQVTCLDGSSKYEPILEADFLKMKLDSTYNY